MPRTTRSISSVMQLARGLAQAEVASGKRSPRSPQLVAAIEAVLAQIEQAAGQGPDITALGRAVRRACRAAPGASGEPPVR